MNIQGNVKKYAGISFIGLNIWILLFGIGDIFENKSDTVDKRYNEMPPEESHQQDQSLNKNNVARVHPLKGVSEGKRSPNRSPLSVGRVKKSHGIQMNNTEEDSKEHELTEMRYFEQDKKNLEKNFNLSTQKDEHKEGSYENSQISQIFFSHIPKRGGGTTVNLLQKINKLDANTRLKFYKAELNLTKIYESEIDHTRESLSEYNRVQAMGNYPDPWILAPHFQYFDFKNLSASFRDSTFITGKYRGPQPT